MIGCWVTSLWQSTIFCKCFNLVSYSFVSNYREHSEVWAGDGSYQRSGGHEDFLWDQSHRHGEIILHRYWTTQTGNIMTNAHTLYNTRI